MRAGAFWGSKATTRLSPSSTCQASTTSWLCFPGAQRPSRGWIAFARWSETIPTCGYPCSTRRDGYEDAQSFVAGSYHRRQRRGGTSPNGRDRPVCHWQASRAIAADGAAAQYDEAAAGPGAAALWI